MAFVATVPPVVQCLHFFYGFDAQHLQRRGQCDAPRIDQRQPCLADPGFGDSTGTKR